MSRADAVDFLARVGVDTAAALSTWRTATLLAAAAFLVQEMARVDLARAVC